MRKPLFVTLAFLALAGFNPHTASAQLPEGIKRVARPVRQRATLTLTAAPVKSARTSLPAAELRPDVLAATNFAPAARPQAGGPTLVKTRIQFRPWTINSYKGDFAVWSWIPLIKLNVEGALPSGARFYVEVSQPNGGAWVKADCVHQGATTYECGDRDRLKGSETLETGVFRFTIKLRNELAGTDQTHFTGRAKVEKALSNEHGPQAARKFVYFANHDWTLPLGHVFYDVNDNRLRVKFWVRGAQGQLEPHLFYRGQEVTTNWAGQTYSGGSCSSDIEFQPTQYATEKLPQRALWTRIDCRLDGASVKPIEGNPDFNTISTKPGEYEVKVLRNGRLSRSIKFTVGSDGRVVDNGTGASIGQPLVGIVPVAFLDDQDGPWDKSAWKTEALYGNPLAGFTWPPQ